MGLLGVIFVVAWITGIIASMRGRSGIAWFVAGCFLTPLALIAVLILPSIVDQTIVVNVVGPPDAPNPSTHVRCPDCRELVLMDARVCKHCRCKLIPQA
jgi:uncharacterized membrane protein YhdT